MKRCVLLLIFCLLLSGCAAWQEGSYVSVKPHQEQAAQQEDQAVAVSGYSGLCRALEYLVHSGKKSGVISIANYNQLVVARDMQSAVLEIMMKDPIGNYAVEDIRFEIGTNTGKPAVAVDILYLQGRAEIKQIKTVERMEEAEAAISQALDNCESGLVLNIENYEERDVVQWVDDYADLNPHKVMEVPQVSANCYPQEGAQRVLELKFAYQNSRDSLRQMQSAVAQVFKDAVAQIHGDSQEQRFTELYEFLMSRRDSYHQETSITPSYTLLMHGVGDTNAFATVYAAMCRQAELECMVVTGTKDGQSRSWNIVGCDDIYYHVDVPACFESGVFRMRSDTEMTGYVWDYSAYPQCGVAIETDS